MVIELLGIDVLIGAMSAWDGQPLSGRLYGVTILPGTLDIMLALWVSVGVG